MGKIHIRYRHELSGGILAVSVERLGDTFQFNFRTGEFEQLVQDVDSLAILQERLPENFGGQERYRKLYCLDMPIDPAVWQDSEFMVCLHDVGPNTVLEALQPMTAVIRNGDDSTIVPFRGNFHAELVLNP